MNAAAKIVTIKIDNVTSRTSTRALAIISALQGKTYMDLQVKFAPVGGSCDVLVESACAESEAELLEMVMGELIHNLRPAA